MLPRHVKKTNEQKYIDRAIKELKKRGYGNVSLNIMTDWLHNGYCSQEDYDLYYDVWASAVVRFSLTDSDQRLATERLMAKFSMG